MKVKSKNEVAQLCLTLSDPMTAAHQAPPSMGFSRQEHWSGVPSPSPNTYTKWTNYRVYIIEYITRLKVQEFSRQEYWNGLPFPPPGNLPDPGIEHLSPASPALADRFLTASATWEASAFRWF